MLHFLRVEGQTAIKVEHISNIINNSNVSLERNLTRQQNLTQLD